MKLCRVCSWRRVFAKGLCTACYFYRRRTGEDRPEALRLKHAQRILDQMHSRRAS